MTLRKIRIWPDPALKQKARPVEKFDAELLTLVDDMFETMYDSNGIGLAATQIAVPLQVLVIDLDPRGEAKKDEEVRQELSEWGYEKPTVFINAKIKSADGSIVWEEGCLSVPGITDEVRRKEHVIIEALDRHGKPFTVEAHGLFAVAVQHEMDHLNGKVFVEYLSKLKRDMIKRKMQRLIETDSQEATQI